MKIGVIMKHFLTIMFVFAMSVCISPPSYAESLDQQILDIAVECREDVTRELELVLNSSQLSMPQLFDTFYVPIPDTQPQKFHTAYDSITDHLILPIIDRYLKLNSAIVFVIAVDRNGYLPTHNSIYSQKLTGDRDNDARRNRTKRIFNDSTGIAAARNTEPYLLQEYSRDTGELMADMSVPIMINNKHWGAIRVGYRK